MLEPNRKQNVLVFSAYLRQWIIKAVLNVIIRERVASQTVLSRRKYINVLLKMLTLSWNGLWNRHNDLFVTGCLCSKIFGKKKPSSLTFFSNLSSLDPLLVSWCFFYSSFWMTGKGHELTTRGTSSPATTTKEPFLLNFSFGKTTINHSANL